MSQGILIDRCLRVWVLLMVKKDGKNNQRVQVSAVCRSYHPDSQ
jgi:hypothetical protein